MHSSLADYLVFCVRRSNSRVSQSIACREKKKTRLLWLEWRVLRPVWGLWASKAAYITTSSRFLAIAKQERQNERCCRVCYFCIYSGIRSIEQAFRVTVLTDMRRDYWFSSPKCSYVNNSNKSLKLYSSFDFNYWLISNYCFILCINNKKEFLNVQVTIQYNTMFFILRG